jgi:hypothetical protein
MPYLPVSFVTLCSWSSRSHATNRMYDQPRGLFDDAQLFEA